jgi:prophage antirepressor-like protein
MNALINLKDCREYMTITLNGKDHQIKLAGTIDDPYFCGRDVCEILGYKNIHKALDVHVKSKHKKDLKTLKSYTFNGSNDPNEAGPKLGYTFLGSLEPLSYHNGKAIYINEPGLYSLIMNSSTPFAESFQDLVYETILPSIRKYGSYQVEQQLTEQLAIKDKELEHKDKEIEDARSKLRSETSKLKKQLRKTLDFNQATKKVEPTEYIYVATTSEYQQTNKFKVGGCQTFELVKSRLTQYNSGESNSNNHFFVYLKKTVSYKAIEHTISGMLLGFRENKSKELYFIHFDWLIKCLDAVTDGSDEFVLYVNENREKIVEDTINKEPSITPPVQLEQIKIAYIRAGDSPKEIEISSSKLDDETITLIKEAIESYQSEDNVVVRARFEEHLKTTSPNVKIEKKKRDIWKAVQTLGAAINPMWRYKY